MDRCQHCHGENGDGKGVSAAVVYPKPRDFTSGIYKFRTHHETVNGNKLAGDADIFRSINEGLHATSMPGWAGFYTKQQIGQLVRILKPLPRFLRKTKPGQPWISAARFLTHRPVLPRAKNTLKRPLSATPAMAWQGVGTASKP